MMHLQRLIDSKGRRMAGLECVLLLLALCSALWVAHLIQRQAQEGIFRWQNDLSQSITEASHEREQALTQLWCERDRAWVSQRGGFDPAMRCPWSARAAFKDLWSIVRPSPTWTAVEQAVVLQQWQRELMAQTQYWRSRMQATQAAQLQVALDTKSPEPNENDVAISGPLTKDVLSLEPQVSVEIRQIQLRGNERLLLWDRWVAEQVRPALIRPASAADPLELWGLALALEGQGQGVGAQSVAQLRRVQDQAQRANHSIQLVTHLPLWLVMHALVTWLATIWVRTSVATLMQLNGLLLLGMIFWWAQFAFGLAPSPGEHPLLMAALGFWMVLSWVVTHFFPGHVPSTPPGTVVLVSILPGWWLFTSIGWLLLLDQSLHFHDRLRFLALEQWWAWSVAALLLPWAAWAAPGLWRVLGTSVRHLNQRWPRLAQSIGWMWPAGVVFLFGLAHESGLPQYLTGELLKAVFLLALCAWCIWKMPLSAQLWHVGHARWAARDLVPVFGGLLWVAIAAFLTADKGPLLVMAMLVAVLLSSVVGWIAGMGLLLLGFASLFVLGADLDVVGERLQAWRDPFTANRDDMARLIWFQMEAAQHRGGFGVGQVPWCGTSRLDACHGLPLQLQSDYTFSALMGWWGAEGAWCFLLLFTGYAYHVLIHCARQTTPLLTPLALLSQHTLERVWFLHLLFLFSVMVIMQTWITVAGNLSWLPLTGITWPLVGYGKTSLWICTLFMGSCGLRRQHA
jgi:cell division protein FtsW (lipid II flippase)